jgi:hypothetical protein
MSRSSEADAMSLFNVDKDLQKSDDKTKPELDKTRKVKDVKGAVMLSRANFVKRLTLPNPAPHHSLRRPLLPRHYEWPSTITPLSMTTSAHAQHPPKQGCPNTDTTYTNHNPWSLGRTRTQQQQPSHPLCTSELQQTYGPNVHSKWTTVVPLNKNTVWDAKTVCLFREYSNWE